MVIRERPGAIPTVVALVAASVVACGKPSPGPQNGEPNNTAPTSARETVLRDVARNAIQPAHERFLADAEALATAVAAWEGSQSPEDLVAAQAAWRRAMLQWEVIEVFRFGPAGAMGADAGGRDLRDAIYSWPTTNACRVDQELVEQSYLDLEALEAEAVNVRGLDAMQYLLFWTEPTNQCDPARSINQDGSWAALDEPEIAARRAAYASAAAQLVAKTAGELVDAWSDGYTDEFVGAGVSSMTFASQQEALNALSNALLYLEVDVKDQKLAEPAGLSNCAAAICPESREFVWTDENFPAIAANLDGFEVAFTGGEGAGFDDLLADAGQAQLSADILAAVADARTTVNAAPPMAEALANDVDAVLAVHAKIKAITDLLKTQFVGVLDLELPDRAEGDND